ncbi:hypothetical protein BHE74_00006089 [Ensete ventricosum]|nr:hypothetical protein BHE74_00006089 [Ensete ventricosum]
MQLGCPEALWRRSAGVAPSRIKSPCEQHHLGREFHHNFVQMLYRVFGVLHQSMTKDSTLSIRDSFFLRALYPKEPSLALVEFLQARFKNIEVGFHHCKPLLVAFFPVGASDCASSARGEYLTSRSSWIKITASDFEFSLFFLPRLIPPDNDRRRLKSTVTGRFRVVTRKKQLQSAVPPGNGRSTFCSAGGLKLPLAALEADF